MTNKILLLAEHSPRHFAGAWFAIVRCVWAIYWVGQPTIKGFISPLPYNVSSAVLSVLAAYLIGYWLGTSILDRVQNKSNLSAALRGALVNLLTTVIYLPVAVAYVSYIDGRMNEYGGDLLMSSIFSLAGIPIHTVIGVLAGISLYQLVARKIILEKGYGA